MTDRNTLVLYRELFVARGDTYAVQREDGRYLRVPLPVTDLVLSVHLRGHVTAGFYALDQGRCRWVCLDADGPRGWEDLREVQQVLACDGIPGHLEHSRRGGHLWVFFEQPVAAAAARRMAKTYLEDAGVDVEVYPKQDRARYGSLVRGPFGIHRLSGQRYLFAQRGDVEEQLEALWERRVPAAVIETLGRPPRQVEDIRQVCAPPRRRPLKGNSPIALLNQVIDVWELASQATKLNPKTGMGSCPLHPPDRHPSFGVNREEQWWIDFHGEDGRGGKPAGGDAFELYCRLEGVSHRQGIARLAHLLR
jgi:hypothetical protein